MQLYVLFEHASGYGLFRVKEFEEVGAFLPEVEAAASVAAKFQQVVQLSAFRAHGNAASALRNINSVSEGILTDELKSFIDLNLPKSAKKQQIKLGVCDPKLGSAIGEALEVSVTHVGVVPEIIRGIRTHLSQFVKMLTPENVRQTELGLGHAYSRSKVKFNIHRSDNMIIQSIALIDQLDKDINTFAMRIREWYSYHFPELVKVVPDNHQYALCANYIKDRTKLGPESLEGLTNLTMDSGKAQAILDVARMSMGMDISPIDLLNIELFAKRVISLAEFRKSLTVYLRSKMSAVAPNLAVLIGDVVGARLISHAGSLTNLAKYPASTVQILGAEKALFRALKTRGNTPKYGLIYHSTFIGRAGTTNKGRISRYLANKCSLASRIDCFSEMQSTVFGEKLRGQVEERLKFFETGDIPRKNTDVMVEAVEEHNLLVAKELKKKKKEKKRQLDTTMDDDEEVTTVNGGLHAEEEAEGTPMKKKKKRKSEVKEEEMEIAETEISSNKTPKKKKKKITENGDMNDSIDNEVMTPVKSSKKKKKNVDDNLDDTADLTLNTTNEDPSKKKKKKKKQKMEDDE